MARWESSRSGSTASCGNVTGRKRAPSTKRANGPYEACSAGAAGAGVGVGVAPKDLGLRLLLVEKLMDTGDLEGARVGLAEAKPLAGATAAAQEAWEKSAEGIVGAARTEGLNLEDEGTGCEERRECI